MNHRVSRAAVAAILAGLAACGGGSEGTSNAAAENMGAGGNSAHNMAADPSNPFEAAEMRMNEQMMAAVGTSAGDSWVRKMIVHHQGAIDMSRVMLENNAAPEVARMARESIEMQTKEVQELQKLVQQGSPDPKSAEIYRPSSEQMHRAMMTAGGTNLNETFLRKMLAHHQGGVVMSDVALQNGVTGSLRDQIQKTRAGQQKEIAMTEAVLRGEPMQTAPARSAPAPRTSPAEPAPSPNTRQAPGTTDRATRKAAPPASQKSTTPPTTTTTQPKPAASSECSAEHAAMGHCTP